MFSLYAAGKKNNEFLESGKLNADSFVAAEKKGLLTGV